MGVISDDHYRAIFHSRREQHGAWNADLRAKIQARENENCLGVETRQAPSAAGPLAFFVQVRYRYAEVDIVGCVHFRDAGLRDPTVNVITKEVASGTTVTCG